jgi:PKD repeat protein
MADTPAPAPAKKNWLRAGAVGVLGLFGGSATMYATAIFNTVVKPGKPVANFGAKVAGLDVTVEPKAIGESGWWDFGDGSALEPFDPAKASLAHTYAKPGTYTIKLTVRNFLMDENERTVPVELGATAAPSTLPPSITNLSVVPVGSTAVAPATFKVVGQVQNADKSMINTTAGLLKETTNGVVDELIVFDKPGTHAVDLIALGPKGGPVKQTAYVTVAAPTVGTLTATVRTLDTGTKIDRQPYVEQCAIPVPTKQNQQKSFEKRLNPPAGFTFKDVSVGGVSNKAVTNVRVEVDKSGATARVVGDWVGSPEAAAKAAGGGEVFIAVKGFAERQVAMNPKENRMTDTVLPGRPVSVKVPKRPEWMGQGARQVFVELTEVQATGSRPVLTQVNLLPTAPLVQQVTAAGRPCVVQAQMVGDAVEFMLRPQ